jgi:DNA repair protein RadA/Sms
VALGEVGLGGEVRHVSHLERRIIEAERMGFRRVIIPVNSKAPDNGRSTLVRVATVNDALAQAL